MQLVDEIFTSVVTSGTLQIATVYYKFKDAEYLSNFYYKFEDVVLSVIAFKVCRIVPSNA